VPDDIKQIKRIETKQQLQYETIISAAIFPIFVRLLRS